MLDRPERLRLDCAYEPLGGGAGMRILPLIL